MRDRPGWGGYWFSPHDTLTFDVNAGHGRLHLPAGLDSSAPDQPGPVFLLDHESRDGTHELHFHVTEAHLRPGLLFQRRDAFHFVGVTVETDRLVLAVYRRSIREAVAHAAVGRLRTGAHVLRVVVSGRKLAAGLWRAGQRPRTQLKATLPSSQSGTPGVLVVGPPGGASASLLVSRYRLSAPGGFRKTAPQATFLITGTPQAAGGDITVGLRAASDIPASIQFEWSHDDTFQTDVHRSAVHTPGPPFTSRTDLLLADVQPLYWRARLMSNRSGTSGLSPVQRYAPYVHGERLVMAAASCAHLWNEPAYDGLHRLLDAAPQPPAILVYQGDLGYAGNTRFSCYRESPDFYAERFARTLADPHFTALRRTVPVGFTLDDHDLSEVNNAPPSEIPSWVTPLWNDIHADPSGVGYFDFRLGDVHGMTLDGRRYADPVADPNTPQKTKLGHTQRDWLEALLARTDASLVVVFSADIFASRRHSLDCFVFGWPDEYR